MLHVGNHHILWLPYTQPLPPNDLSRFYSADLKIKYLNNAAVFSCLLFLLKIACSCSQSYWCSCIAEEESICWRTCGDVCVCVDWPAKRLRFPCGFTSSTWCTTLFITGECSFLFATSASLSARLPEAWHLSLVCSCFPVSVTPPRLPDVGHSSLVSALSFATSPSAHLPEVWHLSLVSTLFRGTPPHLPEVWQLSLVSTLFRGTPPPRSSDLSQFCISMMEWPSKARRWKYLHTFHIYRPTCNFGLVLL